MNREDYLCSVCGASFSNYDHFKNHVEIKHPNNLDELASTSKGNLNCIYSCHVCSRIFCYKRFLRRHIRRDHKSAIEITSQFFKSENTTEFPSEDHNYMDHIIKYEKDDFVEESDFVCGNCGGIFSTLFNLRKHVRSKHPDLLDTLAPRKKIGIYSCDECGKKFSHRKSLGRHQIGKHKSSPELKECSECGKPFLNLVNFHKHMKSKHPHSTATLVLQGIKDGEFGCDTCGKVFSQRKNLRRHVMDKHKDESAYYSGKPVAIYQCPLCSFNKSGDVSLIVKHFASNHNISVITKEKEFSCKESFLKWKDDLEHSTKSSYVKKAHVGSTSYYRCHRSGKYKPRGKGLRNLKVQGTNKIGGFCPAGMQVRINDDKYFVKYSETHVGHTNDLKHLKLSNQERRSLASKIAAQVSLDEILTNVRKSAGSTNAELARLSLVTKQDLANIMRQYNLEGTVVKRSAEAVSLDSWLLKARQNVLYYKPQNCPDSDQPELNEEDFVLIIMTETQRDVLMRYGGGCICLDRTDASNTRFHLTTMSVVDGLRTGFPTAFLISSRVDSDILTFFFTTIKQVVGEINPGLLMTDVAEDFYLAWVKVMGEPGQTLFCLWHVERDWRENLYSTTSESKSTDIFLLLHSIITEPDYETFHGKFNEIRLSLVSDPSTSTFGRYLIDNYSENYNYWSSAYRPRDAIRVDADLERLHLSIKYLYTEVRKNHRLDKNIDSILQFIDNKLYERATNVDRNSGKKTKNISSGHRSSMLLNIKAISEINHSWYISQIHKKHGDYRIDEVNSSCDCDLKCDKCNVCVHRFTCTCPDNIVKSNMCKHIHLVCRYIGTNGYETEDRIIEDESESMPPGYIGEIVIVEQDEILPAYNNYDVKAEGSDGTIDSSIDMPRETNVLNEKKVMIASLSNEILESINSVDEGEAFIQILKAAKPTVASVRNDNDKTVFISSSDSMASYHKVIPVKRVLYTAPPCKNVLSASESNSFFANSIEAHITLDSDGITLLSQAANLASAST